MLVPPYPRSIASPGKRKPSKPSGPWRGTVGASSRTTTEPGTGASVLESTTLPTIQPRSGSGGGGWGDGVAVGAPVAVAVGVGLAVAVGVGVPVAVAVAVAVGVAVGVGVA